MLSGSWITQCFVTNKRTTKRWEEKTLIWCCFETTRNLCFTHFFNWFSAHYFQLKLILHSNFPLFPLSITFTLHVFILLLNTYNKEASFYLVASTASLLKIQYYKAEEAEKRAKITTSVRRKFLILCLNKICFAKRWEAKIDERRKI